MSCPIEKERRVLRVAEIAATASCTGEGEGRNYLFGQRNMRMSFSLQMYQFRFMLRRLQPFFPFSPSICSHYDVQITLLLAQKISSNLEKKVLFFDRFCPFFPLYNPLRCNGFMATWQKYSHESSISTAALHIACQSSSKKKNILYRRIFVRVKRCIAYYFEPFPLIQTLIRSKWHNNNKKIGVFLYNGWLSWTAPF